MRSVISECYSETSLTHTVYLGVALLIVLHEFLLYPFFHHCICYKGIKSLWKITIGIVLQILRIIALIVLDVISRCNLLNNSGQNVSIQCVFYKKFGQLNQTLSVQWLTIPVYLHYTSLTFLLVGVIEFICSQVPYSMKGIVVGAQYILMTVCSIPTLVMVLIFQQEFSIWGDGIISCEFWYALIVLAANLCVFFALMWLAKRYKMRKRDDLLPNEHFFAERYYSSES